MNFHTINYWSNRSYILKQRVPFYLDGFYNNEVTGSTLSVKDIDCNEWFKEFCELINSLIGEKYFPVCRLSDGEYTFICGSQPPIKSNIISQLFSVTYYYIKSIFSNGDLNAATRKGVSSGNYNKDEIEKNIITYLKNLKDISNTGILALHLTYSNNPFQERFHFALNKTFRKNNIQITNDNYYPFYFVYAYLLTDSFLDRIKNKNILIITGSNEEKIIKVKQYFKNIEVNSIEFYKISPNKSLYDTIEIDSIVNKNIDICFVAAGIGKPNILVQLEPLNCPCIDVGFMYEVWANPELGYNRPWCSKNYKQ